MNAQVVAAIIAASVSVLTLIGEPVVSHVERGLVSLPLDLGFGERLLGRVQPAALSCSGGTPSGP